MASSWIARYREACEEAQALLASEVDEGEPYKWQYAAAEALAGGRLAVEQSSDQDPGDEASQSTRNAALGLLDCRRGLELLDTDLLPDGEGAVLSGLTLMNNLPKPSRTAYLGVRLESLNALGALACNRDSYEQAKTHLETAESLVAEGRESGALLLDPPVPDLLGGADSTQRLALVEKQHTLTLFYLAQVYGQQGDKAKSAEYCGVTLCRQLTAGEYDKDDWLQNCTQLAGFYLGEGRTRCCHYMLTAAMALVQREKEAGKCVAEEVEANVQLGWGKMQMSRLEESAAALRTTRQQGHTDDGHRDELLHIPEHLRFDDLDVSVSTAEQVADVESFEDAKKVFNEGIRCFNNAMKCYTQESWFTEHFEILIDVSNLYRSLSLFEDDPHRRCVMQKHRIKAIEKLADDINPKLYMGLYRSAQLECGNVYRDIAEIKAKEGREPQKVAHSALKAISFLEKFLATFQDELNSGKRIESESEQHFLNAQFALGSLYSKLQPSIGSASQANLDTNVFKQSIRHSRNVAEYVKKHDISSFRSEAELCSEMASLMEQKLQMMTRV